MTKRRQPRTFEDAIVRIAGLIGFDGCAAAVGRSEAHVRAWSNPDQDDCPNFRQCAALDAAYLAAGGGEPPLFMAYSAALDRAQAAASPDTVARVVADLARESGEAIAAAVIAADPNASPAQRMEAVREVQEACDAAAKFIRVVQPGPRGVVGGAA